jgi:2-polyprenyl-3-methyl-5-hydroxy-6-metoxy-1,4-benzoquinol methylase
MGVEGQALGKETSMDPTVKELVGETQRIWDRNAAFWDAHMGAGNAFYRCLIEPTVERLLNVRPGQRVLDLACGNGVFSHRLVQLGANVVAADFSVTMLELAARRLSDVTQHVQFTRVDATDDASLSQLAKGGPFSAAVCNMALMDIPVLEPLARRLGDLLAPGAPFVASLAHPCFNMVEGTRLGAEDTEQDSRVSTNRYVRVSRYITPFSALGTGIVGQPEPHHHFHRPLSKLLAPFLASGWTLDALEEPVFTPETQDGGFLSWQRFAEIPPVLVLRLQAVRPGGTRSQA